MERKAILILGMHRSGTSAVAGSLSLMGLDFGRNLIPPAFDNEKGFFENMDFLHVHEDVLFKLASSWDSVCSLPPEWWRAGSMECHKQQIRDIIRKTFRPGDIFAVKDPRLSRLFPLWRDVLDDLQIACHVIMMVRNPLEVALSLGKRNHFSLEKGALLWMVYTLEAERYTRPYRRIVIPYDDFLEQPERFVSSVAEQFNIRDSRKVNTAMPAIKEFLEPVLRHHRVDPAGKDERLPDCVLSLYGLLRDLSGCADGLQPDVHAMDQAAAAFAQQYNFFYPEDLQNILRNAPWRDRELTDTQQKLIECQSLCRQTEEHLRCIEQANWKIAASMIWKMKAAFESAKERLSRKIKPGEDVR